jgi:hypothetical protein
MAHPIPEVTPGDLRRFIALIDFTASPCWRWTGAINDSGYGTLGIGGRTGRNYRAHRVAWEWFVGPIDDGLHLDHLCRNRWCVNPDHLEPVVPLENARRGAKVLQTHCAQGHPFNAANTGWSKTGHRRCKECNRIYMRRRRADAGAVG